jgi:hypothetical protein
VFVQRRALDDDVGVQVDPARNRTRLGDLTLSPDLRELALDGHRVPHRVVPEHEPRPVGDQRPPADGIAQKL